MEDFEKEIERLRARLADMEARLAEKAELEERLSGTLHELQVHQEELKTQNDDLISAQKEIERSHERYRELFDFAPLGYLVANESQVVTEINLTCAKMLGTPRKVILDKPLFLYADRDSRSILSAHFRAVWKGNRAVDEADFLGAGGAVFPAVVESVPVRDRSGRIVRCRTALTDISERRRAEEAKREFEAKLRQAQKMESMGTLTGGIAHEFNNLLFVIIGNTELLLEIRRSGILPEEAGVEGGSCLEEILRAAKRGSDLVRQLLAFSREGESRLRPTALDEEIRRAVEMLRPLFPRMIDIRLDMPDNLALIEADPAQIGQVLTNLCINARDAIPDETGRIAIRTENVLIDDASRREHPPGMRKGCWVLLAVSDTGCGMTKETRDRVFDPFFTTKEVGQGTGLGLSVVYGIVKAHRGLVFCDSAAGGGTEIRIYFPPTFAARTAARLPFAGTSVPAKGSGTILIVDDEEAVLRLTSRALGHAGYEILIAQSGEEALELYMEKQGEIDLVLLDLSMPGMGGRACLRKLVEFDPDAKVIVCSGYSKEGMVGDTVDEGAAAYIFKPFSIRELSDLVRKIGVPSVREERP